MDGTESCGVTVFFLLLEVGETKEKWKKMHDNFDELSKAIKNSDST